MAINFQGTKFCHFNEFAKYIWFDSYAGFLSEGRGEHSPPLVLAYPLGNFILTVNQFKCFEIFNSWLVGCVSIRSLVILTLILQLWYTIF